MCQAESLAIVPRTIPIVSIVADSAEATGLKWAAPAGGGMTLINTGGTALTGASVTIDTIPGTYRNLQLVVVNPKPVNDGEYLFLRINGDSTANRYGHFDTTASTTSFGANYMLASNSMDNVTAQGLSITNIYDYANTTTWKMADVLVVNNDLTTVTNFQALRRCGVYNQTGAITSLVLLMGAGNLNGGTAYLYGVK